MLRILTAAVVSVTAVLAAGAIAKAQLSNATEVVENYDIENVESLLSDLGVEYTRRQARDGSDYLIFANGGVNYILHPKACGGAGCMGLRMLCIFTDLGATLDAANNFNAMHNPTRLIVEGSDAIFHRYLIGDYGYTRGTFTVNLSVFVSAPESYSRINSAGDDASAGMISFETLINAPAAPQNVKPGKPMPGDNLADDLNASQKITRFGSAPAVRKETKAVITSGDDMTGVIDLDDYHADAFNRVD
ncbi:MAG: YbjN domain-containing protein [Hyphococcus sp.]